MSERERPAALGGYIELQLPAGNEYYPELVRLNTGRSCLEYILRAKAFRLIYIPYYTCEVILQVIRKVGIEHRFYNIDLQLEPVLDFEVGISECLLYTNYFGLKQDVVNSLSKKIRNLVVDNAQAFYSRPLSGIDTFYSCRKFFGVPDGAYLQLNSDSRLDIGIDVSVSRFSHLIKRIDLGAEDGYADFIANNKALESEEIKKMSALSQRMLESIDYSECLRRRNDNFAFLHNSLCSYNELSVDLATVNGPMAYPLVHARKEIKTELIARKIFVPTYWPNVFDWVSSDMYEFYLAENLLALPIDHRYDQNDMEQIVDALKRLI